MSSRLFVLGLALAGVHAHAADPTAQPASAQPLAQHTALTAGAANAKARYASSLPAPLISETSVERLPDGTLRLNCTERPNPKLGGAGAKAPIGLNVQEPQP